MSSFISLGQVIDKSITHYRKYFVELMGIMAWIVISALPAALAKLLAPLIPTTSLAYTLLTVLNVIGVIILLVVSVWAFIAIILAINSEARGETRDVKAQNRAAWKLFLRYIILCILLIIVFAFTLIPPAIGFLLVTLDALRGASSVLSSIGGFLMLAGSVVSFVLVVRFSIIYGFAPYALILDNAGGVKALKTSAALVSGRFWATFVRFVLPNVLYSFAIVVLNVILLVGMAIFFIIVFGNTPASHGIGNATWFLLNTAVNALAAPLIAVTGYYIYDSLRSSRA